jgi:hypothetical protein
MHKLKVELVLANLREPSQLLRGIETDGSQAENTAWAGIGSIKERKLTDCHTIFYFLSKRVCFSCRKDGGAEGVRTLTF